MQECSNRNNGIMLRILGDYGPFSSVGKSIGYQVTIGASSFLVDCGAPVFQKIGGHGLKSIKGLIITHCHDDHKRWFSDYALFSRYAPDFQCRLNLLTSEEVNRGLKEGSNSALNSSLSFDARQIVDIAYEDYVDFKSIAPRPRYRIARQDMGVGQSRLAVLDSNGCVVPPDLAKIIIGRSGSPRLLFKDPPSGEWVEPNSFYPFSSAIFYEQREIYTDPEGFSIEAINAPVWHGIPAIGIKFSTPRETLIFSADTNHDLDLWTHLCKEKRPPRHGMADDEFAAASVINGDINDFIERTWSEERYQDAISSFKDAVVIHDIALKKSVVHTDYNRLSCTALDKGMTILTHSPDKMTSEWVLSEAEKTFRIRGKNFFEVVGADEFPCDADYYHKEAGRYFVCYRNDDSKNAIFEHDGILFLSTDPFAGEGRLLCRVDIYEDICGEYFPNIDDELAFYRQRPDGRNERVEYTDEGSSGIIMENLRHGLYRMKS